jgi:hypothetical protein
MSREEGPGRDGDGTGVFFLVFLVYLMPPLLLHCSARFVTCFLRSRDTLGGIIGMYSIYKQQASSLAMTASNLDNGNFFL